MGGWLPWYVCGMERAELVELLTPDGLRLLDEVSGMDTTPDVVSAVSRLRAAGHSPEPGVPPGS